VQKTLDSNEAALHVIVQSLNRFARLHDEAEKISSVEDNMIRLQELIKMFYKKVCKPKANNLGNALTNTMQTEHTVSSDYANDLKRIVDNLRDDMENRKKVLRSEDLKKAGVSRADGSSMKNATMQHLYAWERMKSGNRRSNNPNVERNTRESEFAHEQTTSQRQSSTTTRPQVRPSIDLNQTKGFESHLHHEEQTREAPLSSIERQLQ
jgi:hypothetical protein